MIIILYLHVFLTIWLTGLVWFVQIVHYPMFKLVPKDMWPAYEKTHIRKTTWVTLYPMLLEAITGLIVLYIWYTEEYTIQLLYGMLLNGVLAITVWLSTFLVQVPLHQRLKKHLDNRLLFMLIMTNWYRVFIWTVRSVLVLYLIHQL